MIRLNMHIRPIGQTEDCFKTLVKQNMSQSI